jgi:protein SCO1/2
LGGATVLRGCSEQRKADIMMNLRCALFPVLLLASCQDAIPQAPLAGARIGGPFTLTDQNGKARTDRDFVGKYRIMYFGYTFCPDVCPVDMAKLVAGYRAFAKADPSRAALVVPIFVTVDPARDTPQALKSFTAAFDPALVGLTGTPAQIAAVTKAYAVVVQFQKKPGNPNYLVDHSRAAFLMDPQGQPIALLSQEAKPDVIAGELSKWVK